MTERGRNRLVGAIILTSLAVVVLPMLFDGAGIERRAVPDVASERERVPRRETPVEPETLDPAGEAWDFLEDVEARRQAPALSGQPRHLEVPEPAEEPGQEPELTTPGLDADGLPRAWSVQLAAFRDLDNARSLRQRLLDDGFDAYLVAERGDDATLHRVAVGPRIDRAAAVRLRTELAERYEIEGIVVQFAIGAGEGGGRMPADG